MNTLAPLPSLSVQSFIPSSLFDWDHAVICFQRYSHSELGHVPPTAICLCCRADIGVDTLVTLHTSFSLPLSLSPPLSTHSSFGAQMEPLQAKGSLSCAPYLFLQKEICRRAKREEKYQWTLSAVIGVQQSKQIDTERPRAAKLNRRSLKLVLAVKHDKHACINRHCQHIHTHHVYQKQMWKRMRDRRKSPALHYEAQLFCSLQTSSFFGDNDIWCRWWENSRRSCRSVDLFQHSDTVIQNNTTPVDDYLVSHRRLLDESLQT